MIVDLEYYDNTYIGEPVPAAVFDRYRKRAEDSVASLTYDRVTADTIDGFPEVIRDNYKSAVCAQIEYYVYNGISAANDGSYDSDYTLGRISVSKPAIGADDKKRGNRALCSAAIAYLERTGLMCAAVPVFCGGA